MLVIVKQERRPCRQESSLGNIAVYEFSTPQANPDLLC